MSMENLGFPRIYSFKKDLFMFVNILKNGIKINKLYIDVPYKSYFIQILEFLIDYGYIYKYEILVLDLKKRNMLKNTSQYRYLRIYLKYWKQTSIIHFIKHPGSSIKNLNIFANYCILKQMVLKTRLIIVSTSYGIKAFTSHNIHRYTYGGVILLLIS